jgi:hypothetical protein
VLKKAGILVAAAAAGLVALSPMAFAWGPHEDAPVNHTNVSEDNVGNNCDFGQAGSLVDQDVTGGNALVGAAGLVTGIAAPVDAQTQALNCLNVVSDTESNDNSGNTVRSSTSDVTRDSFNR